MNRRSPLLLQIAIFIAALPAISRSMKATRTPRFMVPMEHARRVEEPRFTKELLPPTGTRFVHAPSVAEMANGDLIASWYGGSDETQPDVVIFTSRCDGRSGKWSAPAIAESAPSATAAIHVHVKSLGNPVIDADRTGVSLYYTAVLAGGWSGGTICVKRSADGVHWTAARRVYTSPLLNVSMLVRGKPVPYTDGSVALPVYHQLVRRWSAIARVARDGSVVDESRIESSGPTLQPWIVPMSFTRALALLRWSSRMPGNVNMATSDDAGVHWSDPFRTALVQRDTAIAGARLSDGSLLAIYNNMTWDRRELSLTRSPDEGVHWSKPWPIEQDHEPELWIRHEYSYPYMMQTTDGVFHIVYTWRRVRIAHVALNESWLFSKPQIAGTRP